MSDWRGETLSIGEGEPRRRLPVLSTVAAVAALAAAFAVGVQSRGVSVAGVRLGEERPPLAAGAVHTVRGAGGQARFAVPVHNASDEPVAVAVRSVPGWPSVSGAREVDVDPGTWASVPFVVRADCSEPAAAPPTLVLAVGAGTDAERLDVPLAEEADALADLHAVTCAEERRLTPGRLAGVWLVERVFGRWTRLEDAHVLLFREDGRMVADPEGVRFTAHRGVLGRWRLDDAGRLTVEAEGFIGYACLPGPRAVWRTGVLPDRRLSLAFAGGEDCPDQPDERWVLRKVAP